MPKISKESSKVVGKVKKVAKMVGEGKNNISNDHQHRKIGGSVDDIIDRVNQPH